MDQITSEGTIKCTTLSYFLIQPCILLPPTDAKLKFNLLIPPVVIPMNLVFQDSDLLYFTFVSNPLEIIVRRRVYSYYDFNELLLHGNPIYLRNLFEYISVRLENSSLYNVEMELNKRNGTAIIQEFFSRFIAVENTL